MSVSFALNKNFQSGFAAITIMLVMILVIITAGALYYFTSQNVKNSIIYKSPSPVAASNEVPATLPSSTPIPIISAADDPKLVQLKNQILSAVDNKIASSSSDQNSPREYSVYFGSTGSTQSTTWTDMNGSDIKFNTANYPGAKAFYFEADLQTDAPDRTGYAQIYDVTHSSAIVGSILNFAGLTPNYIISSGLNFPPGNLQLRIQLKSNLNVTTIYNPRIKIAY